jgi:glycosyltransferase involved in cell wall biosynthesis
MNASPSTGRARRVLFITENIPAPRDLRVQREANVLRDAGCVVSIISPTGPDFTRRREEVDGVMVFRHPTLEAQTRGAYLLEYANALMWELALAVRVWRERGVDVVHVANPPDTLFLVGALLKPLGAQLVFDHHDLCPELYEAKFHRRGAMWRLLRLLERLSFRFADVSIATNESYRRIALERGRMAPDDVFVVRNGPDLGEEARIADGHADLRHGRHHLVVFAGAMGSQDGVDHLLDAARQLVVEERRDIQFVLVGPGTELERLRRRTEALGLADHVTFTGLMPHADLLGVIGAADVCVSPDDKNTLNDHSTMVKVLEYMAAAKPLVQFELTEGRRSAGEASLYARDDDPLDLAAKIGLLLDDPELRRRMGRIGRQRIEAGLAWQHQTPALLAAYEQLDAKRATRRRPRRILAGGVR